MVPLAAAVCAALVQHAPAALAGPDACSGSSVRTCQGNQSAGVSFTSGVSTLNVLNLTSNIAPAAGATGLRLSSSGSDGGNGGSFPVVGGAGDRGDNGTGLTIRVTADGRLILTNNLVIGPFNFSAYGILGFSSGGDGGNGGNGTALVVTPGLGGDGGAGGNGGRVSITSDIAIVTNGASAHGVYGLSRAGNGGDGGNGNGIGLILAQGGDGGSGGSGGTVSINSSGAIITHGASAQGIFARSLGGISGDGGSGTLSVVGKGGAAAGSGPGGNVAVTSSGTVVTGGADARGIFAQSVGGFAAQAGAGGGIVGFGGSGESSGDGGTVRIVNHGAITTGGVRADAIFAESVGGGGGSAGGSGGLFALGGSGAAGGSGETVTVINSNSLVTSGERSRGIFAQSIGGGGGDGGASGGLLTFGGSGSSTGSGGTVNVTNDGAITTGGRAAQAIFAQSLGGGGGDGGVGVGLVTFGGSGGAGGNAKPVNVSNTGALATGGADAAGILAQSMGGGGGNAGGAVAVSAFLGFSLGGAGGPGSSSQKVHVDTQTGTIDTTGDRSHGILAQSVGGGGGNGGFAVALSGGLGGSVSVAVGGRAGGGGAGGEVEVESASAITTRGEDAHALFAQSVGGGGGNGGFSIAGAGTDGVGIAIGYGGTGGSGGVGKRVDVVSDGSLETFGARSYGLLAQSLGGGGGNGGFKITGAGGGLGAGSLSLGGNGSGGGNADQVRVTTTGAITTHGEDAYGLLAQSVGGGGGNGSFAIAAAGAGTGAGTLGVGGFAGGGGEGRRVDVFSHGAINTFGERSTGLLAQSVGGGGGNGGFSITGAGAGTGAGTFNLGGRGGLGGDGNIVYVERTGAITTRGAEAHGLLAQSVGGGGGNGGFSIAGSGAGTGAGTVAIGGFSLGGGDGMAVTVVSGGATETFGSNAVGVLAQSVGGGGGNGAFSIAGTGAGTGSGTFNLGGGGGLGGDGSTVAVTSTGAITTHGAESYGLLAQSLGGGGGNGGFNVSGSGAGTGTGTVGVGGTGDHGGDADTVMVDNRGDVATYGATAHGIFAQSLGGGGGNGGFSISGSGAGTGSGVVSVGGSGLGGGIGGTVDVTNSGNIAVLGSGGNGILAQSLGGGGGNGGFSFAGSFGRRNSRSLTVSVGGSAGGGGSAGNVTVLNRGAIDIAAASAAENSLMPAHGIYAQSIGGGGGNGGLSTALGSLSLGAVFNVSVSVGGTGGAGREGGTVDITNEGIITTRDHDSHGVYAQSIGGGGGQGGSSLNFNLDGGSTSGDKTFSSSITVGGSGGSGNIGGEVIADNRGAIHTVGDSSHGIYAQSIGGGGGDGGNAKAVSLSASDLTPWKDSEGQDWSFNLNIGGNGGNGNKGGKVTVTNSGDIRTEGVLARGIFAQSIGGGGGSVSDGVLGKVGDFVDDVGDVLDAVNLAFAIGKAVKKRNPSNLLPTGVSLTVGGNGGSQGDADEVRVVNDGDITTSGMEAHAIFAQSIGGGGGEAQLYAKGVGQGESASVGIGTTLQPVIGGAGGAAGNGGAVTVTHNGTITTWGEAANGISAQSIGGGGGQAGSIAGGFADWRSIGLGAAFGRSGGSGGDGGNVEVTSTGTIGTHADNAIGIFAQSVGGGGGIIGDVGGIAFAGSVGGNGSAGTVNVTHAGNITTAGNVAHGIFAQSAGGQDMGRAVGVTLSGTVTAGGGDSTGIFAQSRGDQGAGDITVDILSGGVEGGSGSGAGVAMLEGRNNRLTNHGTITTRPGVAGTAIAASTGNETVTNFGTVTGNVDLGAGTNAFDNNTGATFNSGAQAVLGAGNTLTNAGTLSPGGSGNAAVTALSGNLQQSNAGVLAVDLDHAQHATDRIDVTGSADLAGKTRVQNVNAGRVRSGVTTYTILTSAGGVTDSGLGLDTRQAAVIGYQLLFPNTNDILLQTSVNFSPLQGLNPNQRAIGANINSIQSTGGSASFAPVAAALFALPDAQALGAAYDRLSAEGYLATGTGTLFANEGFSNALLSCRVRDGEYRFVREGNCGWMRFSKGSIRQDQTTANFGFDEDAIRLAGGFQRAIDSTWHVGLGLAYQDSDTDVSNLSRTNGQQVQIGGVVKGRTGATTYSASVTAGKGWYDTDRFVNIPTLGVVAASNQDVGLFGARVRLAHAWEPGKNWYVRPMIDAAVTYARFDGFDEVGAGGANLQVASRNETWVSVQPAVEVGGELELADRTLVRPNLKLGITQYVSGTDPSITASFAGAPAGVAPFTVSGEFDRTYLDVDAGVDVLAVKGAVLRIGYAGRFSSHVTANAATLKVSIPF